MRMQGDRGDVILGWLTKVTATLAVLGVVGFDAVSIGAGSFQAEDHAQTAVRAAVESHRADKDLQKAYDAALAVALEDGDSIDPAGFTVAPDGSVTLTLVREVPTVLVEKVGPAREWATLSRTVTGTPAR